VSRKGAAAARRGAVPARPAPQAVGSAGRQGRSAAPAPSSAGAPAERRRAAGVRTAAGRRWATVALAALGAAVSAYLTWVHYSGALALCSGAGGCETVQASRFAAVAGLPVALLGLVLYLALLALALYRALAVVAADDPALLALFGLALAGTLYSAYLTYLELFVIGALCPWCATSALFVTAICALAAWDVLGGDRAAREIADAD